MAVDQPEAPERPRPRRSWLAQVFRARQRVHATRNDNDVQHTRAWTGLYVVVLGDAAIAVAAIFAVVLISRHTPAAGAGGSGGSGIDTPSIVSILTSAFTAIATMTTAYFGIRAASNTAQASMGNTPTAGGQPTDPPVPVQAAPTKAAPRKSAPGAGG